MGHDSFIAVSPGKWVLNGAVLALATSAGFWTVPEGCGDTGLFPLPVPNLLAKPLGQLTI